MMAGEGRLHVGFPSHVIIVFVHTWIALHSTVTVVISFEQSGDCLCLGGFMLLQAQCLGGDG